MDDYAERIKALEINSENLREQFDRYCADHKEGHQTISERLDRYATEQGAMGKLLQEILYEVRSKDKDRETRRIMYGTIVAALFAGLSPIITALIKG